MPVKKTCALLLLSLAGWASAEAGTIKDPSGWAIHREFLSHSPQAQDKKVEVFWTTPEGSGPWPAVLFIHGHQQTRSGGDTFIRRGRLGILARRGYVAATVSQPGYGNSDGPPDYCGPFTQNATLAGIRFLRQKAFVRPDKLALYGHSRGAIVGAMVATKDPSLAAVVLVAGAYDFFQWYPTGSQIINDNIAAESGTSPEAFKLRSAFYHAEKFRSPVLLMHGARDDRIHPRQSEAFAEKLKAAGVPVRLKIFPDSGHRIPSRKQYEEIYPFLERHLH